MPTKVQIAMATYDGEKFLEDQLASILRQSYDDWEIIVRDDGSTDGTMDILERFAAEHPGRMRIIRDDKGNLGPTPNFLEVLDHTTADIVCFADQDDIWHADKISSSIAKMEEMAEEHGENTPLLVHHDITTMDEHNLPLAATFSQVNNVDKSNASINHLLVQNVVTGFTMMVNRALMDRALPAPEGTTSHDAYFGLTAAAFGHIGFIPKSLAHYRIHRDNVWGGKNPFYAVDRSDFSLPKLFNGHSVRLVGSLLKAVRTTLTEKCDRASLFLEKFGDDIPDEPRCLVENFARLADANPVQRKIIIARNGFFPTSKKYAAAFLAFG